MDEGLRITVGNDIFYKRSGVTTPETVERRDDLRNHLRTRAEVSEHRSPRKKLQRDFYEAEYENLHNRYPHPEATEFIPSRTSIDVYDRSNKYSEEFGSEKMYPKDLFSSMPHHIVDNQLPVLREDGFSNQAYKPQTLRRSNSPMPISHFYAGRGESAVSHPSRERYRSLSPAQRLSEKIRLSRSNNGVAENEQFSSIQFDNDALYVQDPFNKRSKQQDTLFLESQVNTGQQFISASGRDNDLASYNPQISDEFVDTPYSTLHEYVKSAEFRQSRSHQNQVSSHDPRQGLDRRRSANRLDPSLHSSHVEAAFSSTVGYISNDYQQSFSATYSKSPNFNRQTLEHSPSKAMQTSLEGKPSRGFHPLDERAARNMSSSFSPDQSDVFKRSFSNNSRRQRRQLNRNNNYKNRRQIQRGQTLHVKSNNPKLKALAEKYKYAASPVSQRKNDEVKQTSLIKQSVENDPRKIDSDELQEKKQNRLASREKQPNKEDGVLSSKVKTKSADEKFPSNTQAKKSVKIAAADTLATDDEKMPDIQEKDSLNTNSNKLEKGIQVTGQCPASENTDVGVVKSSNDDFGPTKQRLPLVDQVVVDDGGKITKDELKIKTLSKIVEEDYMVKTDDALSIDVVSDEETSSNEEDFSSIAPTVETNKAKKLSEKTESVPSTNNRDDDATLKNRSKKDDISSLTETHTNKEIQHTMVETKKAGEIKRNQVANKDHEIAAKTKVGKLQTAPVSTGSHTQAADKIESISVSSKEEECTIPQSSSSGAFTSSSATAEILPSSAVSSTPCKLSKDNITTVTSVAGQALNDTNDMDIDDSEKSEHNHIVNLSSKAISATTSTASSTLAISQTIETVICQSVTSRPYQLNQGYNQISTVSPVASPSLPFTNNQVERPTNHHQFKPNPFPPLNATPKKSTRSTPPNLKVIPTVPTPNMKKGSNPSNLVSIRFETEEDRRAKRLDHLEKELEKLQRQQTEMYLKKQKQDPSRQGHPADNDGKNVSPNRKQGSLSKSLTAEKEINLKVPPIYDYFDPGDHFCTVCCKASKTLLEHMIHLHSPAHNQLMDPNHKPWQKTKKPLEIPNTDVSIPLRGAEFVMPITGYYCELCNLCAVDSNEALQHCRSQAHNQKFEDFCKKNLEYEITRENLLKQIKAANTIAEYLPSFASQQQEKLPTGPNRIKITFPRLYEPPPPPLPVVGTGVSHKRKNSPSSRTQQEKPQKSGKMNRKQIPEQSKPESSSSKSSQVRTPSRTTHADEPAVKRPKLTQAKQSTAADFDTTPLPRNSVVDLDGSQNPFPGSITENSFRSPSPVKTSSKTTSSSITSDSPPSTALKSENSALVDSATTSKRRAKLDRSSLSPDPNSSACLIPGLSCCDSDDASSVSDSESLCSEQSSEDIFNCPPLQPPTEVEAPLAVLPSEEEIEPVQNPTSCASADAVALAEDKVDSPPRQKTNIFETSFSATDAALETAGDSRAVEDLKVTSIYSVVSESSTFANQEEKSDCENKTPDSLHNSSTTLPRGDNIFEQFDLGSVDSLNKGKDSDVFQPKVLLKHSARVLPSRVADEVTCVPALSVASEVLPDVETLKPFVRLKTAFKAGDLALASPPSVPLNAILSRRKVTSNLLRPDDAKNFDSLPLRRDPVPQRRDLPEASKNRKSARSSRSRTAAEPPPPGTEK